MKRLLVLAAVWTILTGCASVAREPDRMTLVRVLGVDGKENIVFTAVSGKNNQGAVERGSGEGAGFQQVREQVPWSGKGMELSLTGVSYVLVGDDVELEELLLWVMEDVDLGASATVWLTDGSAEELLQECEDPAADLELLVMKGVAAPTVAQAAASLATEERVTLPRLGQKDGRVEERGKKEWVEIR